MLRIVFLGDAPQQFSEKYSDLINILELFIKY